MFLPPKYNSHKMLNYKPDMWISEIYYIQKLLIDFWNKEKREIEILEWGSGNSSMFFSLFLLGMGVDFQWHCMENSISWHKKVHEWVAKEKLCKYTFCYLVSPTKTKDKQKQEKEDMSQYIDFPKQHAINYDKKFDFIIVDGRTRVECLNEAKHILNKNGCIILHDAERKEYHNALKQYNGDFVVKNISPNSQGGIQMLWVGV